MSHCSKTACGVFDILALYSVQKHVSEVCILISVAGLSTCTLMLYCVIKCYACIWFVFIFENPWQKDVVLLL